MFVTYKLTSDCLAPPPRPTRIGSPMLPNVRWVYRGEPPANWCQRGTVSCARCRDGRMVLRCQGGANVNTSSTSADNESLLWTIGRIGSNDDNARRLLSRDAAKVQQVPHCLQLQQSCSCGSWPKAEHDI
jgi:hypothetical protein